MSVVTPEKSSVEEVAENKDDPVNLASEALQTVVLAGNPNVGKSVIFNALTGLYANVSNFPGTTVDIPTGKLKARPDVTLKDSPGVYGLSQMSDEELVARQSIEEASVVINVVSAISLERDLFLTQQLIDTGHRVIVALNQMDEAENQHLEINIDRLTEHLGVPVVACVATEGEGIEQILARLDEACCGKRTPDMPDTDTLRQLEENMGDRMMVYGQRRRQVNAIIQRVCRTCDKNLSIKSRFSQGLGHLLLNPVAGLISLLAVLMMLYQVVGVWVAGDIVDFTEGTVMLEFVIPGLQALVELAAPEGHWFHTLMAGEFGVLTMSIQYIFGVLFPLVLGFYVYMSLLEDCGYLPRIAVLADSLLSRIGLNGRAVIPLILGLGCVTMATVSTRVLTSQRERTIASVILAVTVPCSAQLAVIISLMAMVGGLRAWLVYCGALFIIMITLGTVLDKVLKGKSSSLVLDLPPMRMPSIKNVFQKTWVRTKVFINEAAPLFLLGSAIVAVLQVTGLLEKIQLWLAPVTVSLLHLPGDTAQAFIMGMVRRDFGAAGLSFMADSMTPIQVLTALMTITLFVPCIASAAVIWKERGWVEMSATLAGSWAIAFGVGALLCRMLEAFPIL